MEAERGRTLKLLEEDLRLAYVSVDVAAGPSVIDPPGIACTAELAVLRLHGHNAETWEKPNITAAERSKGRRKRVTQNDLLIEAIEQFLDAEGV